MAVYRKAKVSVQGLKAGTLCETEDGYSFCYDDDYLKDNGLAVSLTLPTNKKEYRSKYLFPFFDGLIPEGWLLDVVVRNWKIDPGDRFGLLCVSCRDCIGDVSVEEEE